MPHARGRLPALGSAKPSNLPANADEHVDIRDLTWEDRERVLRLLFAKINNAAPFQPLPPHALHEDPPGMRQMLGMDDEGGSGELPPGGPLSDAAFFVTQQAEPA